MKTHICLYQNAHLFFVKTHICFCKPTALEIEAAKAVSREGDPDVETIADAHLRIGSGFAGEMQLQELRVQNPVTPTKSNWRSRPGLSPEGKKRLNKSASPKTPVTPTVVVTEPVLNASGKVDYDRISALLVVRQPDKYLDGYIKHRTGNLPDTTDMVVFKVTELQFWMKTGGPKGKKCPHKILAGLCGKWLHKGVDFAISKNVWCIKFVKRGELVDLTIKFIIIVHVMYVAQMDGQPGLQTNASMKVLKYLLGNVPLVVKSWRQRMYNYASATIFTDCTRELRLWIEAKETEETERKRMLFNLDKQVFTTHICFLPKHRSVFFSNTHLLFIQTHICVLSRCGGWWVMPSYASWVRSKHRSRTPSVRRSYYWLFPTGSVP